MPQTSKPTDWKTRLLDHHPDECVWSTIETKLDFNDQLAKRLPHLPLYEPGTEIWKGITDQLPSGKRVHLVRMFTTIAASVAALFVLSIFLTQLHHNSLNTESGLNFTTLTGNDMEQKAITEIRQYCNLRMPVCEQSDFQELLQLYDELTSEHAELNKAIVQLGDSPEMIKAIIKIENMKSATLQELIIMIQS